MSLKNARKKRGLTQEQLLRRLPGVSLTKLRRAEKGIYCSLDLAREISLVLDMTIEEIFYPKPQTEEYEKTKNRLLSQE